MPSPSQNDDDASGGPKKGANMSLKYCFCECTAENEDENARSVLHLKRRKGVFVRLRRALLLK